MEENRIKVGSRAIELVRGSVVDQQVDVIVNAANTAMRGGGGVDGAIHRAAGKSLLEELFKVAPGGSRTGRPVLTGAHNLPHKAILHVAGPVWHGGKNKEEELLASCYRNSLKIAEDKGFRSIAFCGISTGIYGFPLEPACQIAVREAKEFLANASNVELVVFAMFGPQEYEVYLREISTHR